MANIALLVTLVNVVLSRYYYNYEHQANTQLH